MFACPPRHYEDVDCVMRLVSDKADLATPEQAWSHAEQLARSRLHELPPRAG